MKFETPIKFLSSCLLLSFLSTSVWGAGLDRTGIGAQSMGMGGASLTNEDDPLSSMGQNPATLALIKQAEFEISVTGAWANGTYRDSRGTSTRISDAWGILPDVVIVAPLHDGAAWGFSITPESTRMANWYFRDPEGGAGGNTSYGMQDHRSEIINVRAAAGFGVKLTPRLSMGGSLGLEYNRNELESPYIFQNHPVLAGFKTLLDMKTDGVGFNGDLGLHWKATDTVDVALTYRSPTTFSTSGHADGDITKQLHDLGLAVPGHYHYDADIDTALPQKAAAGASWKITPQLRVAGQVEFQNWSSAFDTLKVRLSNGNNQAINGVLGTNAIADDIALNWKDIFVYRAGVEYDLSEAFVLRAGYSYAPGVVPGSTLLPMTAAISQQTLACGIGYKHGAWRVDVAYQYDLPASQNASASDITGTEFKNSSIDLSTHWVGLTVGVKF